MSTLTIHSRPIILCVTFILLNIDFLRCGRNLIWLEVNEICFEDIIFCGPFRAPLGSKSFVLERLGIVCLNALVRWDSYLGGTIQWVHIFNPENITKFFFLTIFIFYFTMAYPRAYLLLKIQIHIPSINICVAHVYLCYYFFYFLTVPDHYGLGHNTRDGNLLHSPLWLSHRPFRYVCSLLISMVLHVIYTNVISHFYYNVIITL